MEDKYIQAEEAKAYYRKVYSQNEARIQVECEHIDNMPSAEVRPIVWAYWMPDIDGNKHCSACGNESLDANQGFVPYCPYCGANMFGERVAKSRTKPDMVFPMMKQPYQQTIIAFKEALANANYQP